MRLASILRDRKTHTKQVEVKKLTAKLCCRVLCLSHLTTHPLRRAAGGVAEEGTRGLESSGALQRKRKKKNSKKKQADFTELRAAKGRKGNEGTCYRRYIRNA